ncbi:hypothetical protein CEXT_797031 [Caerostris extrusa]|uniref:Uncharacterized protein n=1 Tax=Caerostris extrusa TaxID=172846 RepID=A0AAV4QBI8_CAEEX|nr:hypothetical protein CEXT_797031 [Caerostris extrusa]
MNGYGIRREKFSNFPSSNANDSDSFAVALFGSQFILPFSLNLPSLVKWGAIDTAPVTDCGVFLFPWRRSLDVWVLDHLLAPEIFCEV